MSSDLPVASGMEVLRSILRTHTHDVRTLDLNGFRGWLHQHLARWRRDSVFAQREQLRDIVHANPRLLQMEREQRRAVQSDSRSPVAEQLRRLERALRGARMAVQGLSAALPGAAPARRLTMQSKRQHFVAREAELQRERTQLEETSPERQELVRVTDELARLRAATGWQTEQQRLRALLRARGQRAGASGISFEERALRITERVIVPVLLRSTAGGEPTRVHVLCNVTLGAARMEIDQLVVRQGCSTADPVEVLAAVEVKRNINDLAHGFRLRRENLAWLAADQGSYDPDRHRTRAFPTGHFDHPASHEEDGRRFVLAPSSFERFRNSGREGAVDGLLFITEPGPVWGLSSASLSRLAHRIATDPRWNCTSDQRLAELHAWCLALGEAIETPDVLRLYADSADLAQQIVLTCTTPHSGSDAGG